MGKQIYTNFLLENLQRILHLGDLGVDDEFTHSLTHGAEPFLRSCPLCSHSRNSQHFMEPEGSLPLQCVWRSSRQPLSNVGRVEVENLRILDEKSHVLEGYKLQL
jgi:hypothetical protein